MAPDPLIVCGQLRAGRRADEIRDCGVVISACGGVNVGTEPGTLDALQSMTTRIKPPARAAEESAVAAEDVRRAEQLRIRLEECPDQDTPPEPLEPRGEAATVPYQTRQLTPISGRVGVVTVAAGPEDGQSVNQPFEHNRIAPESDELVVRGSRSPSRGSR
jgi:hypothetical protein